jgi:predicted dinucleotide-binding enzyme
MKPRVVRTSVIVTIPEKNIMDLPQRDGHIDAIESGTTESRWVSQRLRRPVVKAFNNITAQHLLDSRRLAGSAGRIALLIADDDVAAKVVVSWRQQPGTPV